MGVITSQVSFEIYNEQAVEKLQNENPDLLPTYSVGSSTDLDYNKAQINSTIESAITSGDSIDTISENLADRLESVNENSAVRTARTAAISALNSGTLESFYEAQALGIKVQKQWVATLDSRTRPSHQEADGEIQDLDDKFSTGLQYPGDPSGDPEEIYNCRCTLVAFFPGIDDEDEEIERWSRDTETGEREYTTAKTYEEWISGKEGSTEETTEETTQAPAYDMSGKTTKELEAIIQNTGLSEEERRAAYDALDRSTDEIEYVHSDAAFKMEEDGVEYNPVEKLDEIPSDEEIAEIVGGWDLTGGSCASVAMAVAGEMMGYDVTDLRGEESMQDMRSWVTLNQILDEWTDAEGNGVDKYVSTGNESNIANALDVMEHMEVGETYYCDLGTHASVVRCLEDEDGDKTWEYFEGQSGAITNNGWNELNEDVLINRFMGSTDASTTAWTCFSITLESLANMEEFETMLGYINTRGMEQDTEKQVFETENEWAWANYYKEHPEERSAEEEETTQEEQSSKETEKQEKQEEQNEEKTKESEEEQNEEESKEEQAEEEPSKESEKEEPEEETEEQESDEEYKISKNEEEETEETEEEELEESAEDEEIDYDIFEEVFGISDHDVIDEIMESEKKAKEQQEQEAQDLESLKQLVQEWQEEKAGEEVEATEYDAATVEDWVVSRMEYDNVPYQTVYSLEAAETEEESIAAIAQEDTTDGSCQSCAFAYIARQYGWDVEDFRGDESQSVLSNWDFMNYIAKTYVDDSQIVTGQSSVKGGVELWSNAESGKEYVLCCGGHVAIVRKDESESYTAYSYLELQSEKENGWRTTYVKGDSTSSISWILQDRFGADNKGSCKTIMMDVESLGKSEQFISMLGYINTAGKKS